MDDQLVIEEAIAAFVDAYNRADLNAVLDYYSDDLVKARGGTPDETKSETARRVAEIFERFSCRVEVANNEIACSGDLAFTRGKYRVTLIPLDGGPTIESERRYLEIWRKEGSRWRVARTMDNAD
jgi:ketosteroid isomerase-like protein